MKVFRKKKMWSDQATPLHAVEHAEWGSGGKHSLLVLNVQTWCDKKLAHGKGDVYEEYQKDIHRKQLCDECVTMIKLVKRTSSNSSKA